MPNLAFIVVNVEGIILTVYQSILPVLKTLRQKFWTHNCVKHPQNGVHEHNRFCLRLITLSNEIYIVCFRFTDFQKWKKSMTPIVTITTITTSPHHHITSSPHHLITSPPHPHTPRHHITPSLHHHTPGHHITSSLHHRITTSLVTTSPHHLITASPHHTMAINTSTHHHITRE